VPPTGIGEARQQRRGRPPRPAAARSRPGAHPATPPPDARARPRRSNGSTSRPIVPRATPPVRSRRTTPAP
jgi:hypothetical protein